LKTANIIDIDNI